MVDNMATTSINESVGVIKKLHIEHGKVELETIIAYLLNLKDIDNDKDITLAKRNIFLQELFECDVLTYDRYKTLNDFIYGIHQNW